MPTPRTRGRLDGVAILKTPGVRKALPRYARVVLDGMPPKFQIARRVVFEPLKSMTAAAMWREHARLMDKFRQTQAMVDKRKLDVAELEVPRFSLLDLKAKLADEVMRSCEMCERRCGVDRTKGGRGFCGVGTDWRIFGAHAHLGEEPELVPSLTLFGAGCTMRCVYCQNAPDSVDAKAATAWPEGRVARFVEAQHRAGCRNLNLVGGDPTCHIGSILKMLAAFRADIPVVFNSNAYLSAKAMELMDGVVDVYLLDFRYFDDDCAEVLSSAPRYVEAAKRSHLLAKMQAELIVRVLVIPDHLECDAKPALKWIRENLGPWTRVNVLSQYAPRFRAREYMGICRPLSAEEHADVVAYARKIGLKNLI
ncbi:MAG: radical SAM protein [Candidatus Aenigmatarchaeota archaeon]